MPYAAGIYYSIFEGVTDQPMVVLVHGAGSNRLCWPAGLRRMVGRRVMILDLPGHGRSTDGSGHHSIESYANGLVELFFGLGIYQVVLVGHSMGGAIALDIARRYPRLVAGVGVIASGAYFGVAQELVEYLKTPATVPVALLALQKRGFAKSTRQAIIDQTMHALHEVRPGVLYGDWAACEAFDIRSLVHEINKPAWVAVGAEDKLTPLAYAHFLVDHMPHARLQVVPNAGHMVILEQPDALVAGLEKFLNDIFP